MIGSNGKDGIADGVSVVELLKVDGSSESGTQFDMRNHLIEYPGTEPQYSPRQESLSYKRKIPCSTKRP